MPSEWIEKFFVKKPEMFLIMMNNMWRYAEREAEAIDTLIRTHMDNARRILDLMCGNGRIAIHLAKRGYEVVGIDISEKYIKDARNRARKYSVDERVSFIVGDARELNKYFSSNEFDAVVSFWTSIGYYGEDVDRRMFMNVFEITRSDGLFMILNTMSRERLMKIYHPRTFEEIDNNVFLYSHKFHLDTSIYEWDIKWYKKEDKNLRFIDQITIYLRVYSIHEIVRMLRDCGWSIEAIYDNIYALNPAGFESPINIVAKKRI